MSERAQLLLPIADDELILGWRNSEWTGIAPFLEEDVAFSSIAQNEIGHARALYQLVAEELGTTADELAFDRKPEEYRCSHVRRAAPRARLGEDDRAPLPLRGGGRAADQGADGVRRRARSRASRRRSTARRRTTGCTRRCGSSGSRTSRASQEALEELRPLVDERGEHAARVRAALGRDDRGAPLGRGGDVVTEERVWEALAEIPDPEIPPISIVDLGVVRRRRGRERRRSTSSSRRPSSAAPRSR